VVFHWSCCNRGGRAQRFLDYGKFCFGAGREVFALPGNVNSIKSTGTNKLIKEGAKIVTGIDDILEELNIYFIEENTKVSFNKNLQDERILRGLDNDEKKLWNV